MNKIGGVIVSHGQVANELLSAAETVVGDISHITAVSIGWHDDVDMAKEMMNYSRTNILAQAGTAMLAQANQSTAGVLQLLG